MKETYESIFLKYCSHFSVLNNLTNVQISFSVNPPMFCYIENEIIEPQCYLKSLDRKEILTIDIDNYPDPFKKSFDQLLEKIISLKDFKIFCQKEKLKKF